LNLNHQRGMTTEVKVSRIFSFPFGSGSIL